MISRVLYDDIWTMVAQKKMIEKIEKGISDKEALLAILVAKTNELIEAANRADKTPRSE